MNESDLKAIEQALPAAVRRLGRRYTSVELIEVTGGLVKGLDVEATRTQVRTRLAAAVGAYIAWLHPPVGFDLTQAAFGRLWWTGTTGDVLDVVAVAPFDIDDFEQEAVTLEASGVTVRVVNVESPAHTRTRVDGAWQRGWEWAS